MENMWCQSFSTLKRHMTPLGNMELQGIYCKTGKVSKFPSEKGCLNVQLHTTIYIVLCWPRAESTWSWHSGWCVFRAAISLAA